MSLGDAIKALAKVKRIQVWVASRLEQYRILKPKITTQLRNYKRESIRARWANVDKHW